MKINIVIDKTNRIMSYSTVGGLLGGIEVDVDDETLKLLEVKPCMISNGVIKETNYKEPEIIGYGKTQLQIIQEENEELKKRQQATQEALDYILMNVGGGV